MFGFVVGGIFFGFLSYSIGKTEGRSQALREVRTEADYVFRQFPNDHPDFDDYVARLVKKTGDPYESTHTTLGRQRGGPIRGDAVTRGGRSRGDVIMQAVIAGGYRHGELPLQRPLREFSPEYNMFHYVQDCVMFTESYT